jgi:YbbR domain-containing protein
MQTLKHWILHNWFLKVASLLLATLLWAAVSNTTSSEIGLDVPLEYRNIPQQMEITGDMTSTVQVRLRGSSNLVREITAADVATTIDLSGMTAGEKIVALSPHNVKTPFGAEVIRVSPSSVRFTLERTVVKMVTVVPTILGKPAEGYEIEKVLASPDVIEIEGPESRVNSVSSIATIPILLDHSREAIAQTADLDVPDPQIRLKRPAPVNVKVEIRRK